MPHPVQRTSCDRCHDMKLRCTRNASGACVRCTKAKATCIWTPSIRAQKAQRQAASEALARAGSSRNSNRNSMISNLSSASSPAGSSVTDLSAPTPPQQSGLGLPDPIPSFDSMNLCLDKPPSFNLPVMPQDPSSGNLMGMSSVSDLNFDSTATDFSDGTTSWSGTGFLGSGSSWSSPSFHGSISDAGGAPAPAISNSFFQPNGTIEGWQDRFNQEWAMLSAEEQPLPQPQAQAQAQPQPQPQQTGGQAAADGPGSTEKTTMPSRGLPLDVIRQINDLNVDLFSLSSVVPQPPTSMNQPVSWKFKDVAIDRTFQLSQAFIEAIDKIYPRKDPQQPVQDPIGKPSPTSDASNTTSADSEAPLDQASFLLILSCYQRLIETYNGIFGNMQASMDRSSVPVRDDYVQMPDVKVGAFSLPDSSALQVTLILQLARHLLRRMGSIIRDLNQKGGAAGGDGSSELMALTFQAVTARESDLIERINRLRNTMISLDVLTPRQW